MSLVLAIKNQDAIVVASDTDDRVHDGTYGELMSLPNHAALLIAGNLGAVKHAITGVLPKIDPQTSATALAQLIQASLTIEVIPQLPKMKGRVELVVAGFNPVHHRHEPALFYMDSAQDFYLKIVPGDAVAGGSTAAVSSLTAGHSYAASNTDYLQVLAKECISSTKLRWPLAVKGRIKLGVLTPETALIQSL